MFAVANNHMKQNVQMQQTQNHPYNIYPDGFLEPFTEPVVFRLTERYRKPDPDNENGILMPFVAPIPATSRVQAVQADGSVKAVELALIKNIDAYGVVDFDRESLWIGSINSGMIQLSPNNPTHHRIFNYLNHCPYNRDSKYTYHGADHIVERYSPQKEAKKKMADRAIKKEAIMLIEKLSDKEILVIYSQLGTKNPSRISADEMKDELDQIAFDEPEKIIDAYQPFKGRSNQGVTEDLSIPEELQSPSDKQTEAEALFNVALKKKLIYKHNASRTWKIKRNGHTIFTFAPASTGKGNAEEQLIEEIQNNNKLADLFTGFMSA